MKSSIPPLVSDAAIKSRAARILAPNRNAKVSKDSHYSDEWYTPSRIPSALGIFDLDPCAGPKFHALENIRRPKCGLSAKWSGRVWLNPPYSNIHEWLSKMIAHGDGIALVNSRPDTQWFQNTAITASGLFFLRGRISFERPDSKPTHMPVGSVLFAWGTANVEALKNSGLPGFLTLPG